ncbi:MAG: hypothetical protein WBD02_10625 [Acidimicrobiia bacterium]
MTATLMTTPSVRNGALPRLRLVPALPAPVRRPTVARATFVRRRIVAAIAGAVVFGGVVQAGGALAGSSPLGRPTRPAVPVVHVVAAGESVWSIATQIAPNRDPREVVDAIVQARGTSAVNVGDVITWQG